MLLVAAEKDRFFDAEVLRKMWSRWDEPEIHWYPTSHMGFIPHMPSAIGHMQKFVNRISRS